VAAPDIAPGLQNGVLVTCLPYVLSGAATRFVPVRDMLFHSPPELPASRGLLQEESLLRI
jgi:hypothetical protein